MSLTRLEKEWVVFSPSGNVMCPPGRQMKACMQQGLPLPIWWLFTSLGRSGLHMLVSVNSGTFYLSEHPKGAEQNPACWISPPAQQVHGASHCCMRRTPSEPGSLMIFFRTTCQIFPWQLGNYTLFQALFFLRVSPWLQMRGVHRIEMRNRRWKCF